MFELEKEVQWAEKYEIKDESIENNQWSDAVTLRNPSENTKRFQKGTCRCCLSKGKFENMELKTKDEASLSYADMLRTVLGLNLIHVEDTRLICCECSAQLRQALLFRRQVLAAEKTFTTQRLAADKSSAQRQIDVTVLPRKESRDEKVKTEMTPAELVLTNAESELEVKKELSDNGFNDCDLDDMMDSPQAPIKRKYVKRLFSCCSCRLRFSTELERDEHNRKHLTCGPCKRVFSSVKERNKHKKLHSVQCPVCDEIFSTPKARSRHLINTHGHKCTQCDERIRPHLWYYHRYEVHGLNSTQCGICEKICRGVGALNRHQRKSHMNEKNVQCHQCGFMTFDQITLKKHMVSHNTEKNFLCDYCNKKFTRKSSLRYHVMIHSGLKPKVCKFCGEAFVQRASLKYHLEKHHPGDCC